MRQERIDETISDTMKHILNFLRRVIGFPIERVTWLAAVLRIERWIIQGVETSSQRPLIILYAGNGRYPANKNLIAKLAFDQAFTETHIGKAWLWNAGRYPADRRADESLLVVLEVPRLFRSWWNPAHTFFLPTWFDGRVEADAPAFSDSTKSDIKRIKKNGLRYVITADPLRFKSFYDEMHVPYIAKTFGERAFIHNYRHMLDHFGPDRLYQELLLVLKGDEPIAGILLGREQEGIYLHYVGVKDGNLEYVQEGALGALFYFPVDHARSKGLKSVNFGLTRPFLNDGVLQFKKKRGMAIAHTYEIGYLLQTGADAGAVTGFLLNNPFLYRKGDEFCGAVFVEGTLPLTPDSLKRLHKEYYLKGMTKLILYPLGGSSRPESQIHPADIPDHMVIASAADFVAGRSARGRQPRRHQTEEGR